MEHKVNLNDVSDGKYYTLHDMVKLGCDGCNGSASCCRFAEDTITLDPFDLYQLSTGEGLSFELLYTKQLIALAPVNGLLLPHLNFAKETKSCPFLNNDGLCKIHASRPGLCRLFPLARYFEAEKLSYILQIHECPNPVTPKVKVKNWIGLANAEQYEEFLLAWHQLVLRAQQKIAATKDTASIGAVTTALLKLFFLTPYTADTIFYSQFAERLQQAEAFLP
ncbi:MAG: YkgJ family cysteine cluster protein [Lachnospiraceae bacterium]|nr:YkgJ family cysteine cluster protein [Lachnospiraceae bacterium]